MNVLNLPSGGYGHVIGMSEEEPNEGFLPIISIPHYSESTCCYMEIPPGMTLLEVKFYTSNSEHIRPLVSWTEK